MSEKITLSLQKNYQSGYNEGSLNVEGFTSFRDVYLNNSYIISSIELNVEIVSGSVTGKLPESKIAKINEVDLEQGVINFTWNFECDSAVTLKYKFSLTYYTENASVKYKLLDNSNYFKTSNNYFSDRLVALKNEQLNAYYLSNSNNPLFYVSAKAETRQSNWEQGISKFYKINEVDTNEVDISSYVNLGKCLYKLNKEIWDSDYPDYTDLTFNIERTDDLLTISSPEGIVERYTKNNFKFNLIPKKFFLYLSAAGGAGSRAIETWSVEEAISNSDNRLKKFGSFGGGAGASWYGVIDLSTENTAVIKVGKGGQVDRSWNDYTLEQEILDLGTGIESSLSIGNYTLTLNPGKPGINTLQNPSGGFIGLGGESPKYYVTSRGRHKTSCPYMKCLLTLSGNDGGRWEFYSANNYENLPDNDKYKTENVSDYKIPDNTTIEILSNTERNSYPVFLVEENELNYINSKNFFLWKTRYSIPKKTFGYGACSGSLGISYINPNWTESNVTELKENASTIGSGGGGGIMWSQEQPDDYNGYNGGPGGFALYSID